MPTIRINHEAPVAAVEETMTPPITKQVHSLVDGAYEMFVKNRDRITARAYIRGAVAMLGEGLKPMDTVHEAATGAIVFDEDDYAEACENARAVIKKLEQALSDNERSSVVLYLKSLFRLLGNGGDGGSGSLTPRPRDYDAAMSRFSEGGLNSPSQTRGPTSQERIEHSHSFSKYT